jgi:hypothetical protein
MIKELVKMANHLDKLGHRDLADSVDGIISKVSFDESGEVSEEGPDEVRPIWGSADDFDKEMADLTQAIEEGLTSPAAAPVVKMAYSKDVSADLTRDERIANQLFFAAFLQWGYTGPKESWKKDKYVRHWPAKLDNLITNIVQSSIDWKGMDFDGEFDSGGNLNALQGRALIGALKAHHQDHTVLYSFDGFGEMVEGVCDNDFFSCWEPDNSPVVKTKVMAFVNAANAIIKVVAASLDRETESAERATARKSSNERWVEWWNRSENGPFTDAGIADGAERFKTPGGVEIAMSSSHAGKPNGAGGQVRYKKPGDARWTSGAYDYLSIEKDLLDQDGYLISSNPSDDGHTMASKARESNVASRQRKDLIEKRASLVNDLSQLFIDESSFYSR